MSFTIVDRGVRLLVRESARDGHTYVNLRHLSRDRDLGLWLHWPGHHQEGVVAHRRDRGDNALPGASLGETLDAIVIEHALVA